MNETKLGKNRIDYLDIAKGIAILLVVLGHTYCQSRPGAGMIVTPLSRFIYSFHMPLFFVACGITSSVQEEYSKEKLWATIKKNFYSLLIPYIAFSLIYMQFSVQNILRMLYASNVTIIHSGARCVQLWYLPCFFVARMFMYGVLHLSSLFEKKNHSEKTRSVQSNLICLIMLILSFAIGFSLPKLKLGYPFNLDVSFVALGFIIFGYILKNLISELDKKSIWIQILLFTASSVMLCLGNRYGVPDDFVMEMYCSSYGSVFWCVFNGISGIVMVRSLSTMIERIGEVRAFSWIKKSLTWLGKNTMGIFLLHQPMNILFIMPWMESTFNMERGCLASGLIMTAVILSISIVLTTAIKKVFPGLLGIKK